MIVGRLLFARGGSLVGVGRSALRLRCCSCCTRFFALSAFSVSGVFNADLDFGLVFVAKSWIYSCNFNRLSKFALIASVY